MEGLLILLGATIVIGIPSAVIWLLVRAANLNRRLGALEAEVMALKAGPDAVGVTQPGEPVGKAPARTMEATAVETREVPDATVSATAEPWRPWQPSRATPTKAPAPETTEAIPPRAVVFRAEKASALAAWFQANWIYAVAAVSLGLAGVFLVQYGIEKGYLTPVARVTGALGFGALLVVAGEFIRRRWGDGAEAATAYLPSVFSSAGIVTLFAAILAALHFYTLITPVVALIGLVMVAALAVVLGWFSGPLLAAVGITGAVAAPFLVGGESSTPEMFYGYFGLIALVGMMIDAVRRWAWVTVLSLILVYGAALALYSGIGQPEWMMALMAVLAVLALLVPPLALFPAHDGAATVESLLKSRPRGWPVFPTRVVAGSMLFSVLPIALLSLEEAAAFWLALGLLVLLFAALAVWARRAGALEDIALLPVIGVLSLPILQSFDYGHVYAGFHGYLDAEPGTPLPWDAWTLVGAGAVLSLMAAWRSLAGARWPIGWAAGAAMASPLMMVGLEVFWLPADVLGAYLWALTAAALAVMMAVLAGSFARADGDDKQRVALFTLATLSMISFALIIVLSETALTLALALTVLAAAVLDRRFGMKPLSWFVQAGVIVIGWRLIIDPGVSWAEHASYPDLIAGYGGSIAVLAATLVTLRARARVRAGVVTESAVWTLAAVFGNVLVFRLIDDAGGEADVESHWAMGLASLVWFASAANQLWRLQLGGPLKWVRLGLFALYGAAGLFFLALAVTVFNPLSNWGGAVLGPVVINTLFVAYALPALLFAFVAWKYTFLKPFWRIASAAGAAAIGALWLGLDIRHFWRGAADMNAPGVTQPELYTYTIALLIIGAGLLYQAIAKGSAPLRRIAMSVIAVTVAKVFLIDISGLQGLMRVFSFLALGLALAGLAFLNRWAAARIAEGKSDDGAPGD
jgi:uncharacterized membrane protein